MIRLKGVLVAAVNITAMLFCIWLAKLLMINYPESKKPILDFVYDYKITFLLGLTVIVIAAFTYARKEDGPMG